MFGSPTHGNLARSPLEMIAIPIVVGVLVVGGVLWGSGIVVGSILGATLPGSVGQGLAAMVSGFPDVGAAWEPAIPSALVWSMTLLVIVVLAPLIWRLMRAGALHEEGAQWASTADLRSAGLLVADRSLPFALPESSGGPDEG